MAPKKLLGNHVPTPEMAPQKSDEAALAAKRKAAKRAQLSGRAARLEAAAATARKEALHAHALAKEQATAVHHADGPRVRTGRIASPEKSAAEKQRDLDAAKLQKQIDKHFKASQAEIDAEVAEFEKKQRIKRKKAERRAVTERMARAEAQAAEAREEAKKQRQVMDKIREEKLRVQQAAEQAKKLQAENTRQMIKKAEEERHGVELLEEAKVTLSKKEKYQVS